MLKFLVYRVATIVPVLIGVSIVVFLMMKLIPGDPVEAILGPAATTPAAAPAKAAPAAGDPVAGKAKFKTLCVTCHKADGTGGFKSTGNPTPNWTLKKTWDATRTDAYLRDCITNGKPKSGMVAWGKTGVVKPAEIENLRYGLNAVARSLR